MSWEAAAAGWEGGVGGVVPAAGGGSAGITWLQITQADLDAATDYVGSIDTADTIVESGGRITGTIKILAGTADGIREMGGKKWPLTYFFPDFDADAHDLFAWLDTVANSTSVCAMALALCDTPGTGANGVGMLLTTGQCRAQQTGTAVSAGAVTGHSGLAQFGFSAASATGELAVNVTAELADGERVNQSAAEDVVDLSDPDNVYVCLLIGSYSGALSAGETVTAGAFLGYGAKVASPVA